MVAAAWCAAVFSHADEPKKDAAAVTGIEPASLITGAKATLKLRGFKLKDATEVKFPKVPGLKAEIKEKKDAGKINNLENTQVGESQLLVEFTLPADLPAGLLEYVILTPSGEAAGSVPVVPAASVVEEKEPNNGFRAAQKLEPGKAVRGTLQPDKDVDVFEYPAGGGKKLKITVTGGSGLLMDASLACYDLSGNLLGMADDTDGRNPALTLSPQAPFYICVSDAHDKGGEWHSYLLTVEETK